MEEEINTVLIGLCIVSLLFLAFLVLDACILNNSEKGIGVRSKDRDKLIYLYTDMCIENDEDPMKDITYEGMLDYIESKSKSLKK